MKIEIGKLYKAVKMLEGKREANPVIFKDVKCMSFNKIRFLNDNETFVLLSQPVVINKPLAEYSYKILTTDGIIAYMWDNKNDALIFTKENS